MQLGSRIKVARTERNFTQEELAEQIGISQNYLSAIERNAKLPKLTTFIRIANTLQVSADYLLEDDLIVSNQIKTTYFESAISQLNEAERKQIFDVLNILLNK